MTLNLWSTCLYFPSAPFPPSPSAATFSVRTGFLSQMKLPGEMTLSCIMRRRRPMCLSGGKTLYQAQMTVWTKAWREEKVSPSQESREMLTSQAVRSQSWQVPWEEASKASAFHLPHGPSRHHLSNLTRHPKRLQGETKPLPLGQFLKLSCLSL